MPYEKVGKNEPVCIADKVPFEIPDNWMWCHISDVCLFQEGPGILAVDFRTSGIPLIRIAGMQGDKVKLDGCNYLDPNMVAAKWDHFRLDKGDIVVSTSASLDKIAEVDDEAEGAIPYTGLIRFKMFTGLSKQYFTYFIKSPCYVNQIAEQEAGAAIKHYGPTHLRKMFIPIPPIEEQKRIIKMIEAVLPSIKKYAKAESTLDRINKQFPDALRKSILQQAVMGKLVPQDPNDEPASVLLERIRAEKQELIKAGKLKKDKYESIIYRRDNSHYENRAGKEVCIDGDIPFDIPASWCWCHISDMCYFQEGPGILGKDFRIEGVPLIRIAGMQTDRVTLDGCNYLDPNMVEEKWNHFRLDKGDIVVSTSASLDKIAEVDDEAEGAIPYTGLIRFKMFGGILKEYFMLFIKSPCYINQIAEQEAGAAIKHYGPTHLRKMVIPIPPITEQQRIVAKVKSLSVHISAL